MAVSEPSVTPVPEPTGDTAPTGQTPETPQATPPAGYVPETRFKELESKLSEQGQELGQARNALELVSRNEMLRKAFLAVARGEDPMTVFSPPKAPEPPKPPDATQDPDYDIIRRKIEAQANFDTETAAKLEYELHRRRETRIQDDTNRRFGEAQATQRQAQDAARAQEAWNQQIGRFKEIGIDLQSYENRQRITALNDQWVEEARWRGENLRQDHYLNRPEGPMMLVHAAFGNELFEMGKKSAQRVQQNAAIAQGNTSMPGGASSSISPASTGSSQEIILRTARELGFNW